MPKTQSDITRIKRAFRIILDIQGTHVENQFWILYKAYRADEKLHRQRRDPSAPQPEVGISAQAKRWAVARVCNYILIPQQMPTLKDYFSIPRHLFTAAALALNQGAEIRRQLEAAGLDIHTLALLPSYD